MYESLKQHCICFHLYIFPFDDKCLNVLTSLKLENVTLVPLHEFEDKELLSVKPTRTKGEYCWTSTSSTILFCIEKFSLEHCTYLDADIYFYNSPALLLREVEGKSVLITDHRYSKQYNRVYDCGKYCVQFIFFRNDEDGMKALRWWRNECIEWCYNRQENGKFGDQKYLDDWIVRFNGIVELQHLGGGVAPWNVQQYEIYKSDSEFVVREISSGMEYPLVFYHFHELKFISAAKFVRICEYEISRGIKNVIYFQYVKHLSKLNRRILKKFVNIRPQEYLNISFNRNLRLFINYIIKRDKNLIYVKRWLI